VNLTLEIATLPLWLAGLLVVVVPTALTMCGPVVVRRLVGVEGVIGNNEVAGFKFATLGVVYAVLLGLAVIAVWEKFAEAEGATTREAGALASVYRLASGLDPEPQRAVAEALSRYAQSVVDDDWPEMARGGESAETQQALNEVYAAALALGVNEARDAVLLDALLTQLDLITNARRERLALAVGIVPNVIWLVLFTGAAMTLGFTFFFGLENLRAQVLMAGMLALVIFLALFVAISIDHPFTGPVHVPPEPIALVFEDFGSPPD
jgi:hypothetical protein